MRGSCQDALLGAPAAAPAPAIAGRPATAGAGRVGCCCCCSTVCCWDGSSAARKLAGVAAAAAAALADTAVILLPPMVCNCCNKLSLPPAPLGTAAELVLVVAVVLPVFPSAVASVSQTEPDCVNPAVLAAAAAVGASILPAAVGVSSVTPHPVRDTSASEEAVMGGWDPPSGFTRTVFITCSTAQHSVCHEYNTPQHAHCTACVHHLPNAVAAVASGGSYQLAWTTLRVPSAQPRSPSNPCSYPTCWLTL